MKAWKQFLSLVLVTCLLTSLFGVVSAAGPDGAQDTGVQDTGPKYVGVFDSGETNTNLTLENRETTIKFYLKNVETGEKLDVDSYQAGFGTYFLDDSNIKITNKKTTAENEYILNLCAMSNTVDGPNQNEGGAFVHVTITLNEDVAGTTVNEKGEPRNYYESCTFTITGFPSYEIGLIEVDGVKKTDDSLAPPFFYGCTMKVGESKQLYAYVKRNGELLSNPEIVWSDSSGFPGALVAVDSNGVIKVIREPDPNYDTPRVATFEYIPPESDMLRVWGKIVVSVDESGSVENPEDPDDKPSGGGSSGGSSSGSSGGGSSTGGNSGTAMPNTGSGTITTPGTGTTTPGGGSTAGGASAPNSQPQGCVSDTVGNFNIFGAYQYKFTPTNGQAPVVTVSNSNFRVVQVAQEDGSYYYKVYSVGAPGTTCDVYVNGTKVSTVTASEPYGGVSCDTTAPFTVKKGGSYQFMFTAASRPTVSAGSSSFHVEFAGNDGDKWYFKAVATGNAGDGCGFYVNGAPFTVAVAHIGE